MLLVTLRYHLFDGLTIFCLSSQQLTNRVYLHNRPIVENNNFVLRNFVLILFAEIYFDCSILQSGNASREEINNRSFSFFCCCCCCCCDSAINIFVLRLGFLLQSLFKEFSGTRCWSKK